MAIPRIAVVVHIDKKVRIAGKSVLGFFSKNCSICFSFLFFFLDIFASKEWKKLELVESEYLKKSAADLPGTLLYSKAESTVRTYATGWQRWKT